MRTLPISHIPVELSQAIREVGRQWAISELRPRIDSEVIRSWDKLVNDWVDSDLPLVIRKGGIRGGLITHSSGRKLVLADNSPAQWAFSRAYSGNVYPLSEINLFFERDQIPFAYILTKEAKCKAEYKCTLSKSDNVNAKYNWKLCHIKEVGINKQGEIENTDIQVLKQYSRLLLQPSNHFLIPKKWGGLGEVCEVIDEIVSLTVNG